MGDKKQKIDTQTNAQNVDPNHDLAARAAWHSYIGGYSQTQIAVRLGVSKVKVHRLLNLAQKMGIVKSYIENVPADCIKLENQLMDHFGLKSCQVVPDLVEDCAMDERSYTAIGGAGARFLQTWLENKNTKSIGVGKGRTLTSMVKQLVKIDRPDIDVYSIAGSLYRSLAANPFDIVLPLSAHIGGRGYFLPVPYIANDDEEKAQFRSQKFVQEMLNNAKECDLFVIGLGALGAGSHVVSTGMISEEERVDVFDKGAVSDLLGSFLDIDGDKVDATVNRLHVGIEHNDLEGKPVLALAGGEDKAEAILSSLRAGIITDLITDEAAAKQVCALLDEKIAVSAAE